MKAKSLRWLQLITGIHRVHHVQYSWGWVHVLYPDKGYFPRLKKALYGRHQVNAWNDIKPWEYHDCTQSGIY